MFTQELQYILAIRETGNITKAAELLHIAQPSLSQKLQRMEAELGVDLFHRLPNGVSLTQAGELYCQMASQTLNLYQGFLEDIGKIGRLENGNLRIGANWYITTTILPKLISDFKTAYPNIRIDLYEHRSTVLLEMLRSGKLDAAFVSHFPTTWDSGARLCYEEICSDPFCVITPKSYPAFPDGFIPMNALRDMPLIMFQENQRIRQITDQMLETAGIRPKIDMTTYGFPMAVEQVAAGHGAAILPSRYIESIRRNYPICVYKPEEPYNPFWNIGICYFPAAHLQPTLRVLLERIKKQGFE